ncbi:molybdopterin-synthase adenylyltransferase MoeB [Luteolibacter sp. SL250]|uniref:molybdopterin-synthase adenylyltransferase MoeB n=1 Tax=Luteolibacter sp. SL250 TaxID=2995170 RepID=UPI00226F1ADF|nr:molybdopterin-synthase adenylyltransferase MoeB [Luteolibacter sp. SL250]WAC19458.1 molybdopterin-synthase adenylyltransferase MoeB [Luteolibacter sp. SL250]
MASGLSKEELLRYSRHLLIPGVGVEGQLRLKNASVLMIGTGGLGCPAALYLAAAGVGRLGLIDPDTVDVSNLQRQILHGESWIGKPKLDSAESRLREINPHLQIDRHAVRFTPDNALELAEGYDIILDGCDNFPTRFLSNDTAYFLKKPLIYGAIHRFEGQATVFAPHLGGPCYRCLLPELPPPGSVPSCNEAGVLGVLPGVIGSLQAMEAIKLILGIGNPPLGKLTVYDALNSNFRTISLRRDPGCRLCGDTPEISGVSNPETLAPAYCDIPNDHMETITTAELRTRLAGNFQALLIDVREPDEYAIASIPGAVLIPLGTMQDRLGDLPKDREIIIHCKAGGRSARAVNLLLANGFTNVKNVEGGIDAWLEEE